MQLLNIPNTITIIRILLLPFFVAFLVYHNYLAAFVIFVIAGLSDALDGFLARKMNQQSELGRLLDPLADKLLLIISFIAFSYIKWVPAWFTILVLSRDLFLIIGWFLMFLILDIKTVQPTIAGKASTALQMFLVAYILLRHTFQISLDIQLPLIILSASLTVLSGIHYLYKGLSYRNG